MIELKLEKSLIEAARSYSEKMKAVCIEKGFNQKFENSNNDGDRFLGNVFEFAGCKLFGRPLPVDKIGSLDHGDIEISGQVFDFKASRNCLVNKKQHERKKVDGYIFGRVDLLDFYGGLCFARFYGWIEYERVQKVGELQRHENGSESYKIPKARLRKMEVLLEMEKRNHE